MHLSQVLDELSRDPEFRRSVVEWRVEPAVPARTVPLPDDLDPRLAARLSARGVDRLFTHQERAYREARAGRHVLSVTPTASGKTLAYALPVLQAIADDADARALMVFPTKALAQDQKAVLSGDLEALGGGLRLGTYDGDTPPPERARLRRAGSVILTNPDMLHAAILPHHTQWVHLFENLRYVVLDELHTYRGVFGAHVASVIRRLNRLCAFYGSSPRYLATSATIGDPARFAERLLGEPVALVDDNGAPRGARHVVVLRPPLLDARSGAREGARALSERLAARLGTAGVSTILFHRSRQTVELSVRALKGRLGGGQVAGYRGGYLPSERRAIELALREGRLRCVVSTNALELGVDIGALDAAILSGYPGSIASLWQEAGRAGRRGDVSAVFLVAGIAPLDQYLADHPGYLFGQSPETPAINPDNRYILMDHVKCAAFELPFSADDRFGVSTTPEMLRFLADHSVLHAAGGRYYWASDGYPAQHVSLRSASTDNFVVIEQTERGPRVLGEVDRPSAPTLIHEEAIYMHGGRTYQVEKLDYEEKKAWVRAVEVDYYTEAELAARLAVQRVDAEEFADGVGRGLGDVEVSFKPTVFKKLTFEGQDNVGWGQIHLPEEHLQTVASWWDLEEALPGPMRRTSTALAGCAHVLGAVAPLFLMCDRRDLGVQAEVREPRTGRPTLYLYDRVPAGVGLAEAAYGRAADLFSASHERVLACGCDAGCPSCVGPGREQDRKPAAAELLGRFARLAQVR